jgi:diaminopimelate decarboxylase
MNNKLLSNILDDLLIKKDTPFFLYDVDVLQQKLKLLTSQKDVKLYYAVKANPLSPILKEIHQSGIGFDCASLGELNQVLSLGVNPSDIIITGPSKSLKYFKQILSKGVRRLEVESLNQILWLNQAIKELNLKDRLEVILRFQLEWETDKDSFLGGNSITPFGLGFNDWEEVFNNLDSSIKKNLNFIGMHVFQWGNITDEKQLFDVWKNICIKTKKFSDQFNLDFKVLDFGGGLGVDYNTFENNNLINWTEALNYLNKIKKEFELSEVILELGRYIVAECGYYFSQVIDRKKVRNKNILVCQGGVNHLIRPSLINEAFPSININSQSDNNIDEFQVHGPLCTSLDHLGEYKYSSKTKPGDWLCFSKVGAYGFTESMPYFLCHELPAEILAIKKADSYRFEEIRPSLEASSWLK